MHPFQLCLRSTSMENKIQSLPISKMSTIFSRSTAQMTILPRPMPIVFAFHNHWPHHLQRAQNACEIRRCNATKFTTNTCWKIFKLRDFRKASKKNAFIPGYNENSTYHSLESRVTSLSKLQIGSGNSNFFQHTEETEMRDGTSRPRGARTNDISSNTSSWISSSGKSV